MGNIFESKNFSTPEYWKTLYEIDCPKCKANGKTNAYYTFEAFRILSLPIIPIAKRFFTKCEQCQLTLLPNEFPDNFKKELDTTEITFPRSYYIALSFLLAYIGLILLKIFTSNN